MSLPLLKTGNANIDMLQTKWKSEIDPVLANPITTSSFLTNVSLSTGKNTINHKLGRQMQGWIITDINGIATIYRSAPMNNLTLTLTASAPVVVSLEVF